MQLSEQKILELARSIPGSESWSIGCVRFARLLENEILRAQADARPVGFVEQREFENLQKGAVARLFPTNDEQHGVAVYTHPEASAPGLSPDQWDAVKHAIELVRGHQSAEDFEWVADGLESILTRASAATTTTTTTTTTPSSVRKALQYALSELGKPTFGGVVDCTPIMQALIDTGGIDMNASAATVAEPSDKQKWRCFHCDETFNDAESAALHFGKSEMQSPACQIDIAEYRAMEHRMHRYNEEDTDLHREIHGLRAKHQVDLMREEEKGYARGLADGMKEAAQQQGEASDMCDASFVGGAQPTHYCKVCNAMWRRWDDGSWNLRSKQCGKCCDNVVMGDQIVPMTHDGARVIDGSAQKFAEALRPLAQQQAEPKCDTCKDTGQICVGTSGLESDGNAPLTELCPECGYGDAYAVSDAMRMTDDGEIKELRSSPCTHPSWEPAPNGKHQCAVCGAIGEERRYLLVGGAPQLPTDAKRANVPECDGSHDYGEIRDGAKECTACCKDGQQAEPGADERAAEAYVVMGYGETDLPQVSVVYGAGAAKAAVIGMIYHPSTDCPQDEREEYLHGFDDPDNWSQGEWEGLKFEIGGVRVWRADVSIAAQSGQRAGERECRHCGWMCRPNDAPMKKWHPLEQEGQRAGVAEDARDAARYRKLRAQCGASAHRERHLAVVLCDWAKNLDPASTVNVWAQEDVDAERLDRLLDAAPTQQQDGGK